MLKDSNLGSALADLVTFLVYESVPVSISTTPKHEDAARRVCAAFDVFQAC